MRGDHRRYRLIAAAVSSAVALIVFAALGGAGLAQTAIALAQYQYGNPSQYQYGKKITICHKGKNTITVSVNAWPAHLRHGDTEGPCPAVQQAGTKVKKAKKNKGQQATESSEPTSSNKTRKTKKTKSTASGSSAKSKPASGKTKQGNDQQAVPSGTSDQTGSGKPGTSPKPKKTKQSGKSKRIEPASPPAAAGNGSSPPGNGNGKGNGNGNGNGRGNGRK